MRSREAAPKSEEGEAKPKRKLKLTNIRTRIHRIIPQEVLDTPALYDLMNEREPHR